MARRRPRRFLGAFLVAVALVNLPLVHSVWTSYRIDRDGEDVTATVVDHRTTPEWNVLSFRFPEDVDPEQALWQAEVDEATYDAAVAAGEVEVRVLPDHPSRHRVEGEVGGATIVVVTLVVDLLLLAAGLLMWWVGRGRRGPVQVLAMEDVRRGPPGAEMSQVAPETYLVRGEVAEIAADRIVLDLDGRTVEVLLNGYRNPVGHQQAAQVHGRLV